MEYYKHDVQKLFKDMKKRNGTKTKYVHIGKRANINEKQAKIYALRIITEHSASIIHNPSNKLSLHENEMVKVQLDEIHATVRDWLRKMGDTGHAYPWDSEHVREIY